MTQCQFKAFMSTLYEIQYTYIWLNGNISSHDKYSFPEGNLRAISQRVYELMIQISCKYMSFLWDKTTINYGHNFFTCHDSSAVMACAQLRPDCSTKIKIIYEIFLKRFQLWAHKCLVECVPDSIMMATHAKLPPQTMGYQIRDNSSWNMSNALRYQNIMISNIQRVNKSIIMNW